MRSIFWSERKVSYFSVDDNPLRVGFDQELETPSEPNEY